MALSEIADFIFNLFQLLNYLLKISTFIGKVLVDIIAYVSFIVWKFLQGIGHFLVVFYEDYSYFIEDFRTGLSSIAIFFIECLTAICNGILKGVLSIGNAVVAGYQGIGALLSGRLLTVPIFTFEFLKQLLVLIGNGVWFLVTLPGHFAKSAWEWFDTGLKVIGNFSKEVGSRSWDVCYRLASFLVQDVPLQSAAGIGVLVLAYMNPKCTKRIVNFQIKILRYILRKLLPYGRGIRRKFLQFKQKIAQINHGILVIIITGYLCLQNRANSIYDTLVLRTATYFRNFFAFSNDHRQLPAAARSTQHLSRIENRQDHSSSEASSRSSSNSSNQSTESSRSRQPFAQTPASPGKKTRVGPVSIGLCIICEDNEKSVVLVPCGHLCLCKRCADQLGNYDRYCPICRTLIYRKVDVYI